MTAKKARRSVRRVNPETAHAATVKALDVFASAVAANVENPYAVREIMRAGNDLALASMHEGFAVAIGKLTTQGNG